MVVMRLVGKSFAVSRHHMVVMRLLVCEAIQPERLNAEGDSPSALSRGLSVSATPGIPTIPKKSV